MAYGLKASSCDPLTDNLGKSPSYRSILISLFIFVIYINKMFETGELFSKSLHSWYFKNTELFLHHNNFSRFIHLLLRIS